MLQMKSSQQAYSVGLRLGLLDKAGRQHCINYHQFPFGELEGKTGTSVFKITWHY